MQQQHIRNFSIIAHIDHGKSTLADRIIHLCGGLSDREMEEQVLDSMDIERERGITIKAQTAALKYKARSGQVYNLNLIDTPGHVDFSYEVSRSLSACEGALLVVDASQGVEAQTVANCYTAIDLGVEVMPVLNKIDLPSANPDNARHEIEEVIGIDATDAILASAKTGLGVEDILEAIIERIPAPEGDPEAPFKALLIDSWFDNYVGVVMLVRVVDGELRSKDKIKLMATGSSHLCEQVGVFTPKALQRDVLRAGEVGYVISGIKELQAAKVGDTLTIADRPATEPLPGFKEIKSQVFAGLYPVEANQYDQLRESLEKLKLTTRRCTTSRKSRKRSVSASAAASSASCTWRSCRSAWSASLTRISSPLHRPWCMRSKCAMAPSSRSKTRPSCRTRPRSTRSANRSSPPPSSCRRSIWVASSPCATRSAAIRWT